MELLEIKKCPDKILKKKCKQVKGITENERKIFDKMLFTMRYFCGIGLAAPQIGISKKLIIAEIKDRTIKLANPEIVKIKGIDKVVEGCLSVPDFTVEVKRPYEVVVKGLSEEGRTIQIKTEGLLARVLQHEIDHLNGILITDHAEMLNWRQLP